jgi:2-methylcitrate dehydratase PrpD
MVNDMEETKVIADYVVKTKYEELPPDVIDHTKNLISDTIACGFGGRKTPEGDALLEIAKAMGGNPQATIIGGATKVSCEQAIQINRVTTNMLDYDDAMIQPWVGHMSTMFVPVALAFAEYANASGKDVISALVPAYEVNIRLREAVFPSPEVFSKTFEGVDSGLSFAATAIAGKLIGLNSEQMANALGLTGYVRIKRVPDANPNPKDGMAKWMKVTSGDAVIPSIHSALLAKKGFIGDQTILDQGRGYEATVGSDRYDATKLIKDLGKQYRMLGISFKFYASCRLISTTLDAVAAIASENGLKAEDVRQIVVKVQKPMVNLMAGQDPKYMIQAQFSVPHCVTMVLMGVPTGPAWFTDQILSDPKVRAFRQKIKLEEDPEATKIGWGPMNVKWVSTVELTTNDDRHFSKYVEYAKGDPQNPFTHQDHIDKLVNMASYAGLKKDKIDKLIQTLDRLEELNSISELCHLLVT